MFLYCNEEKFEKLVNTNIITIKIYYYLINKCKLAGLNTVSFSYKELQEILNIGHTSVARSIKTLKELELIKKTSATGNTPVYEIPREASGVVEFNFKF